MMKEQINLVSAIELTEEELASMHGGWHEDCDREYDCDDYRRDCDDRRDDCYEVKFCFRSCDW